MVTPVPFAIANAPKQKRILRSPKHSFFLQTKPFGIYPFLLAPVLPGETLKNLTVQSRVVSDPVVSPLLGWWKEYYIFYVKLRDLPAATAAAVEAMILDPSSTLAGVIGTADSPRYYFAPGAGSAMNWAAGCMERVVECYFRDQDEGWFTQLVDTDVPCAKFPGNNWMDSLFATSEMPVGATAVGAEDFDDFELRWRNWLVLRQQLLTDMTFEDYLRTFGVNLPDAGKGKPELLRYCKDYQYPSNTVNPSTGAPTSALSWSIQERADKDRFFTEPGFIFGVTVTRPKCYRTIQSQTASVMLDTATAWMPAILKDDPSSSLRTLANAASNSPLVSGGFAAEHILDQRDLYMFGDQWVYAPANKLDAQGDYHNLDGRGDTHFPNTYPLAADIEKLFVDRTPATATYVREDGVVNLSILGTQMDMT